MPPSPGTLPPKGNEHFHSPEIHQCCGKSTSKISYAWTTIRDNEHECGPCVSDLQKDRPAARECESRSPLEKRLSLSPITEWARNLEDNVMKPSTIAVQRISPATE